MNVKKALKIIKKNCHHIQKVEKVEGKWLLIRESDPCHDDLKTDRELVAYARMYSHNNTEQVDSRLKKYSHSRNRAATRDLMKAGKFEEIPLDDAVYEENPWYWD